MAFNEDVHVQELSGTELSSLSMGAEGTATSTEKHFATDYSLMEEEQHEMDDRDGAGEEEQLEQDEQFELESEFDTPLLRRHRETPKLARKGVDGQPLDLQQ